MNLTADAKSAVHSNVIISQGSRVQDNIVIGSPAIPAKWQWKSAMFRYKTLPSFCKLAQALGHYSTRNADKTSHARFSSMASCFGACIVLQMYLSCLMWVRSDVTLQLGLFKAARGVPLAAA